MVEGLVSTVIPVYNRPVLIKEAVRSVLVQTHRPIEIIIIDDGSTDETPEVLKRLARKHRHEVRVVRQANKGVGLAREAGRVLAKGEFIQYLDSDDLLLPKKFEVQIRGIRSNPDYGISYGMTRKYRVGEIPKDIPAGRTGEKIDYIFPTFLRDRWWQTSTPLYRRQVCDQAGPWTNLRTVGDYEYDCRIATQGVRLHFCPEFVSEHRSHSGSRITHQRETDKLLIQHRAIGYALIYGYGRQAGYDAKTAEFQYLAQRLFWFSRRCGAAGLVRESEFLFTLAREGLGDRGRIWPLSAYGLLARLFGWSSLGKLSCKVAGGMPPELRPWKA